MIHNRPSLGAVREMLGADYTHDVDGGQRLTQL